MSIKKLNWLSVDPSSETEKRYFFQLPTSVIGHPTMSIRKIQVLAVISKYADKSGLCATYSPCEETIAEYCNWYIKGVPHASRVSAILSDLVADGWVTIFPPRGINRTNQYQLHQLPVAHSITDRSTIEYLSIAEAKRTQVLADYAKKPSAIGYAPDMPDEEPEYLDEDLQSKLNDSATLDIKIQQFRLTDEFEKLVKKELSFLRIVAEEAEGKELSQTEFNQLKIQAEINVLAEKF